MILAVEDAPALRGQITPRIADLRLSVIGADSDERRLPQSPPWTAPEYHSRHWKIERARKMDVFSFGLVCFWILSWDRIFHRLSEEEEVNEIERLKGPDNDMMHLMKEVNALVNEMELEKASKDKLREFFHRTLAKDPEERAGSAAELFPLLILSNALPTQKAREAPLEIPPNRYCDFQLSQSIAQLTMANFRARQQVFHELQSVAESCCESCRKNALFQLALCCELAFGTAQSSEARDTYLSHATKDSRSLRSEVENMKVFYTSMDNTGALPWYLQADLVHEYQIRQDLDEASVCLKREIQGRSSVFETHHPLVTCIQSALVHVHEALGQGFEAQFLQNEVFLANKAHLGDHHPETLAALAQLVLLYDENGQSYRAVEKGEQLLDLCRTHLGRTGRTTMSSMANLAKAYMGAQRWQEAERMQKEACALFDEVLGPEHPDTLRCLSNLAVLYRSQPRPNREAEEDIKRRLSEARESVYRDLPHRDSLAFEHIMLASEKSASGGIKPLNSILSRLDQLHNSAKSLLTKHHPDTWLFAANFAATEADLGQINSAITIFNEAKENLERLLGPSHAHTLQVMITFAGKCQNHGLYEQSDQLLQEVLARDPGASKEFTDRAIQTMYYIGKSYLDHGREEEARKVWEKVIHISRENWGVDKDFPPCRAAMAFLPNIYIKEGKVDIGLQMHRELVEWHEHHLEERHEKTMASKAAYAEGLLQIGHYQEAMDILQDVHTGSEQELGSTHDLTRSIKSHMAYGFNRQDNPEEAARISEQLISTQKTLFGPWHEDTLLSMNNLALYCSEMGEHETARDIRLQVLEAQEKKPPSSALFLAMHNLASSYQDLGKLDKAVDLQLQLLQKQREFYGRDNRDVFDTIYALAFSLSDIPEKLDDALEYAIESLTFFESTLGCDHPSAIRSAGLVGWILKEQGKLDQAREMFEKELEGSKKLAWDSRDDFVKDALRHLEDIS